MKNQIKKLSAALAVLGLFSAGMANAATATGSVTVTGTAVVNCTVSSPTVDYGAAVASGTTAQIKPVSIDVNCPTGTAWSLATNANSSLITVGADTTTNSIRLEKLDGNIANAANPVVGTGTGAVQTQSMQVRIGSSNGVSAVTGTGAISGSIAYAITY